MEPFVMPEGVGWIEVITGPMCSGKSEELVRRIRRAYYAKQEVQVFTPSRDTRGGLDTVESRNGSKQLAEVVNHAEDILAKARPGTNIIAIDEGQFLFDPTVPGSEDALWRVCDALADKGYRVIVSGLDQDFKGDPFPPMARLMSVAESVLKFSALCTVCGKPASRTILMTPASGGDFLVGSDMYEARCREHSHAEQGRK